MRFTHYIWIAPLLILSACHREEFIRECGPIELQAGIVEGSASAQTKAGAEDNHAKHQVFTGSTKLRLQVSGTWTEHGTGTVTQTTTATVGTASDKHNALNFSAQETLYWDDYGTADPANASTGRTQGLTIYGAAINGKTTAPTVSDWTALSWTLTADQTTSPNTPADKDLLISNNVQAGTGDGTYKFADRNAGKLLEFKHALSKITVVLTPGNGFGGSFTSTAEVKLTSNLYNATTNTEWPYIKGSVNVSNGTVTLSENDHSVITMYQSSVANGVVTKEALVMPGSAFASDTAIIARINADGNIYYVTAEKIRTAINQNHASGDAYPTEAGKNYIINVTVNKTDIVVTATVTNWTNVEAEVIEPVINISGNLGGTAPEPAGDIHYSFYRSESLNSGYIGTKQNEYYYPEESVLSYTISTQEWSMSPILYWPNHNTHYQFRAVWPQTVTTSGAEILSSPRLQDGTESTAGCQVIKVQNVAYAEGTFPSDLQIARPNVPDANQNCGNNETGHTKKNLYTEGICAREGVINLTFNYMMSQVEVNLSTVEGIGAVLLTNAVVDIINVYSYADVKLGDREVVTTGSTGAYTLDTVAGEGNENKRWSAIVPQTLTWTSAHAAGNVQFRITITNSDSTTDIYYADINPILKYNTELQQVTDQKVAPNGKWESGMHYVYNLRLSKTEVKVSATLADWTTVTANENVWF